MCLPTQKRSTGRSGVMPPLPSHSSSPIEGRRSRPFRTWANFLMCLSAKQKIPSLCTRRALKQARRLSGHRDVARRDVDGDRSCGRPQSRGAEAVILSAASLRVSSAVARRPLGRRYLGESHSAIRFPQSQTYCWRTYCKTSEAQTSHFCGPAWGWSQRSEVY